MKKRIIALILCAVMLMCVFSGCEVKSVEDLLAKYGVGGNQNTADETDGLNKVYNAALAAYDANEVVLNVNGEDVTWGQYIDWIWFCRTNYESYNGEITDFNAETSDGTFSDTILKEANYYITLYKGVENYAAENNITFTPEMEEQMKADWDANAANYSSEEEFTALVEQYYGSVDLYNYMYKLDSLYPVIFEDCFGASGEKVTDEELAPYLDGYLMAKHILIMTQDESGNELDEAGKAEAKAKIQDIYDKLNAYEGDDLEGYFDELVAEYSEDPGSATSPDGYLFQEGDMVDEFYQGTLATEEGHFSEIVESSYGYHIIFRVPVDPNAVPSQAASYGYSLKYLAASEIFQQMSTEWAEEVTLTTTDFYNTIDLNKVFGISAGTALEQPVE